MVASSREKMNSARLPARLYFNFVRKCRNGIYVFLLLFFSFAIDIFFIYLSFLCLYDVSFIDRQLDFINEYFFIFLQVSLVSSVFVVRYPIAIIGLAFREMESRKSSCRYF